MFLEVARDVNQLTGRHTLGNAEDTQYCSAGLKLIPKHTLSHYLQLSS